MLSTVCDAGMGMAQLHDPQVGLAPGPNILYKVMYTKTASGMLPVLVPAGVQ